MIFQVSYIYYLIFMVAERKIRPINDELARDAFDHVRQAREQKLDLMIGSPAYPPNRQRNVVYLNTALELFSDFLSFEVLHTDSPDPQERKRLLEVMANQPEFVEFHRRLICEEISGVRLTEILNGLAIQRAKMKEEEWAEEFAPALDIIT